MLTRQLLQGTGSQSTFMRFCQRISNLKRKTESLSELATILGHGKITWLRSLCLSKHIWFTYCSCIYDNSLYLSVFYKVKYSVQIRYHISAYSFVCYVLSILFFLYTGILETMDIQLREDLKQQKNAPCPKAYHTNMLSTRPKRRNMSMNTFTNWIQSNLRIDACL